VSGGRALCLSDGISVDAPLSEFTKRSRHSSEEERKIVFAQMRREVERNPRFGLWALLIDAAVLEGRPSGDVVSEGVQLLTAEDLAERWQVGKAHVYRLTREGRLPTVRLGRYCRYRPEAIEEWEQRGGVVAANDLNG
jgi:excisionase family DNA binding protein